MNFWIFQLLIRIVPGSIDHAHIFIPPSLDKALPVQLLPAFPAIVRQGRQLHGGELVLAVAGALGQSLQGLRRAFAQSAAQTFGFHPVQQAPTVQGRPSAAFPAR